jgi:branched-chain amino acid transport system permease protein
MGEMTEAASVGTLAMRSRSTRSVFWWWSAALFVVIFGPSLFIEPYVSGLLLQAYIFAVLAVATDVAWGYTGILTFASAAMFGIGAYAVGVMFVHVSTAGWSVPVALFTGVSLAVALSAVIGWLAFYSRVRVSEFYIAVVTLGLSVLFSQTVSYGGALTGGSNGLSGFPTISVSGRDWYLIAAALLFASMLAALRVMSSDFGLVLRAVRDHEIRCRYLGIHTPLIKTLVFTACNGLSAAAGVAYALYTTVVAPSLVGIVLATNVLIWVMLGGRGTIIGPVVAAVLVNVATPELSASIPLYWQGALGLAFIMVVVLLPRGLIPGIWAGLRAPFRRARPDTAAASAGFSAGLAPRQRGSMFAVSDPAPSADAEPAARMGVADRPVLEVKGVSKSFGSFHALTEVSLSVRRGELISIVGPNGAGKTSLVRCISDGQERTAGEVAIDGRPIGHSPPDIIVGLGMGRKFQGASVFDSLTTGECLRIASWVGRIPSLWGQEPVVRLPAHAAEVVETLGLREVWSLPARDISHGQRQALELAMVLSLEPRILVLDEPTAGLTSAERSAVGRLLTRLVSTGRLAVLLIEHDFNFVKEISTRIVVLHEGRILADGSVAEVANSRIVKDVYLGRSEARATS